ncbi:hypothetical protein GCM10009120_51870 [Sphingobacterium siyangense subsp. cladoniae]
MWQAWADKCQLVAFKVFQMISYAALAIATKDVGELAFTVKMIFGEVFVAIFSSNFKNPVP